MTKDTETIRAKLKKIAALAERGVGGEKDNAKRLLAALLIKYRLTVDDIREQAEQERRVYSFAYRTQHEKSLLFACYFRAMNVNECSYHLDRGRIYFKLTKLEAAELQNLWDHFRPLWRKEVARLRQAFELKHELYSSQPTDHDEDSKPMSREELLALMSLMNGMQETKYVSTRRMLEGR